MSEEQGLTEAQYQANLENSVAASHDGELARLRAEIAELSGRLVAANQLQAMTVDYVAALPPLSAAGLVERMKVLRWLLDNSQKLPALLQLLSEFKAAEGLQDKWDVVKLIGDEVVDIAASFPFDQNSASVFTASLVYVPVDEEADALEVCGLAEAQGIDFDKLKELAEFLVPLIIELLLKLRG